MKPTVYIETTIPSYYCDGRPEIAEDIARTRQWWDEERGDFECFTSAVVLDELESGSYPTKTDCLNLIKELPLLVVTGEIVELAELYQARQLMPKPPVRDALHLALATYYRMEYLLTWNCRHLANVRKLRGIETLNQQLGLPTPILATPHMLQRGEIE